MCKIYFNILFSLKAMKILDFLHLKKLKKIYIFLLIKNNLDK